MIGKVPSNTVAKVFAPPNWIRKRSKGFEVRSASGIVSMPNCSTSVGFGLAFSLTLDGSVELISILSGDLASSMKLAKC